MQDWVDTAGIGAFVATVITAAIAWITLLAAKADGRERTRPLVTASLQVGPTFVHGAAYLVVANHGATAARDVVVEFHPDFPTEEVDVPDDEQPVSTYIARRYASKIEVMAPGQRLVNVYRHFVDGGDQYAGTLADCTKVTVSYHDGRPRIPLLKKWPRSYKDQFLLRPNAHDYEQRINPGPSNRADLRQNQALESIAWELWEDR